MHILINRGLPEQLSSHSLVLTSYFAYLIVSEFSAFQAPHAEILMLTFLLRANMYTIGADPDQAVCLIGANIVHDYKCTYGPRDTNLTNLIYFMLTVIHLVTLQVSCLYIVIRLESIMF